MEGLKSPDRSAGAFEEASIARRRPSDFGKAFGIWAALSFWSCFRFAAVTALSRTAN